MPHQYQPRGLFSRIECLNVPITQTGLHVNVANMSGTQNNIALNNSVLTLRQSVSTMSSSLSILSTGIADFPRMKTVLSSMRHYELIPSSTLKVAHESLHGELGPAIEELLRRVEAEVGVGGRLERREEGLKARYGLLEGRMGDERRGRRDDGYDEAGTEEVEQEEVFSKTASRRKSLIGGDDMETKLRMLQQKKERLAYAVERLTLQSQQKQRQLRMSVAATKD